MSHYASETFLHQLLGKALAAGATDIHLKVGRPPGARVGAELIFFRVEEIRAEDTDAAATLLLGSQPRKDGDVSFAYEAEAVGRFRVTTFRQRTGLSIVLRPIPAEPPTIASLQLPVELGKLVETPIGLVVIAGPPSSGRSSTAAALVRHLNERRSCHIVTFEDPVEHLHADRSASVAQRRVGLDVPSLEAGLVSASRQDVDCVYASDLQRVSELVAAFDLASRALVLAVVGAADLAGAVGRLSHLARSTPDGTGRLADVLRAVVAQRLVPVEGGGFTVRARLWAVDAKARDALRRGDGAELKGKLGEGS